MRSKETHNQMCQKWKLGQSVLGGAGKVSRVLPPRKAVRHERDGFTLKAVEYMTDWEWEITAADGSGTTTWFNPTDMAIHADG